MKGMVSIEEIVEIKKNKGKFETKITLEEVDTGTGIAGEIQIFDEYPEDNSKDNQIFSIPLEHFEHFKQLISRVNAKIKSMKEAIKSVKRVNKQI